MWYYKVGKDPIAISSRVRLARNFKDFKFPHIMTNEEANKMIESIEKVENNDTKVLIVDFYSIIYYCNYPFSMLQLIINNLGKIMKSHKKTTLRDIYLATRKSRKITSATFGEQICQNDETIEEKDIHIHVINSLTSIINIDNEEV